MHERVTLLGGTFRVESQPGKGTHITAEVPLPETEDTYEPYQERNTSISEATEKTRIILADDHELSRAGVRSMIIGEHWLELVGEATNGNEALDLCQRLRPDLALIDIRMPEMDGLQTTRAMKRVSPTTKVIIVTIHEHPDYLSAAIRAGAAGYLLKDTSRRELLRAIRHVLRGESFLNTELTQRLLQTMSGEQHAAQPTPHDTLTPREKDVLRLLTQGLTNRQIAAKLVISPLTVKVHVKHIIEKFQVSDRTQAAVRAVELGIV
jgi:DNA-binding NarL/FixJ family response regulator